ncbi:MAG: GTP 3',8-cyclase MoaA [Candidatus Methylacidiphilales bacterium]|nr:GTP 3',8-cyclase MoaA [Candidatus Methylacidiphilales bacterium]
MPVSTAIRNLPAQSPAPPPRRVDYMRLSITDRCNERCLYCMPENFSDWMPRQDILSYDEILAVAKAGTVLGFKHFRVTGGEPLLRQGVPDFIRSLHALPGVESVQITTNATQLARQAQSLAAAGLKKINVSLDALDPAIYRHITRGELAPVLEGIRAARNAGIPSIKLNCVLMRGKNDSQILPLVRFAAEHDLVLRFIELMPVSLTEMLDDSNFLPVAEVKRMLEQLEPLVPVDDKLGQGPARYFRMQRLGVTLGFIGALTDLHFCDNCNKVRLTADGKIRPCLGNHGEFDLKPALRPDISPDHLESIMRQSLTEKPPVHLFRDNYTPGRIMTAIGG